MFWCTLMVRFHRIARLNEPNMFGVGTVDRSAICYKQGTSMGILLSCLTTDQRNAIAKLAYGVPILSATCSALKHIFTARFSVKWGQ